MATRSEWKAALDARGIRVWVAERVVQRARGVVVDPVIDKILQYRDESFRLFSEGNTDAAFWAAQAMQDRAVELDCAVEERTETVAGRKLVMKSKEANAAKKDGADAEHTEWQERAAALWRMPQHASKPASEIARLIDKDRWNTVRRHIRKSA